MNEKILLIDDDDEMRALMRTILEHAGYQLFDLSDGRECLEKSIEIKPELILLDILMPTIGGFEVCEQLKADDRVRDIPIIFLTSLVDSKDKIKGLGMGGVDYINKNGDMGEFLARIQMQLKIRALAKEIQEKNEKLIEKQQILDEDLRTAATIQRSLLPSKDKYGSFVDIAWRCQPCQLIGGDIFNVIPQRDGSLAFYILDVSGHGVTSAMITVSVSQVLHQYTHDVDRVLFPGMILKILNKEFPLERFDKFFTIFYMIINQNGNVYYSNAAHPMPILLRPNQSYELLEERGGIIGWSHTAPFEEGWVTLNPGDKLILYTDGVTEFQNAQGIFFGEERFYALLEQIKHKSIDELVENVLQELQNFGKDVIPRDDLSLLAIEFKGNNIWTSKSHSLSKEVSQSSNP